MSSSKKLHKMCEKRLERGREMSIPVLGFIFEQNPEHAMHSHQLFIKQEGDQRHVHEFFEITTINDGHNHVYVGTTDPAPNGVPHIHEYHTWTHFINGHRHEIKGKTGPAIPASSGGHIHYFEGFTSGYPSHSHWYSGKTRQSME